MFVGVLRLSFHLPSARSLKEKRQVVRSFRDRVRARLDVSIAEVADQDLHQRATFGVAVVSASSRICDEILSSVAAMAGNVRDAVLLDRATEIVAMGELRGDESAGDESALESAGDALESATEDEP